MTRWLYNLAWLATHLDTVADGDHWRAFLNAAFGLALPVREAYTDQPLPHAPAYCRWYQVGFVPRPAGWERERTNGHGYWCRVWWGGKKWESAYERLP